MAAGETMRISADDKHKIPVGALAVSRYFSIRRYFPLDDAPNYNDHDFPGGSKITPSGYLIMRTPMEGKRLVKELMFITRKRNTFMPHFGKAPE